MEHSFVDNYLHLVRADAQYLKEYLRWMGTEVMVLKPKKSSLKNYEKAYGASASTFERTPENYEFNRAYISIDAYDFGLKENIHDLDVVLYLPDNYIETGDLIQFEKMGRMYTYEPQPLNDYQGFVYRCAIKLIDVVDLTGKQDKGQKVEREDYNPKRTEEEHQKEVEEVRYSWDVFR